jgi:hypothetical protein
MMTPGVFFESPSVYTPDGRTFTTSPVVYNSIASLAELNKSELIKYFDSKAFKFYNNGFTYLTCTELGLTIDRLIITLDNIYDVFCIKMRRICPDFIKNPNPKFIQEEAYGLIDSLVEYLTSEESIRNKQDIISVSMSFINNLALKIYNDARSQLTLYIDKLTSVDAISDDDILDAYEELNNYIGIMMGDFIYEDSVFYFAISKIESHAEWSKIGESK